MEQTLTSLPSFKILQPEDCHWLGQTGTQQELATGDILVKEGTPTAFIYLVLKGAFTVSISQSQSEAEQEIARCSVGEMLGEMSLMDDRPPSATIRATEPSQVLAIPKRALKTELTLDADFAARFYQELAITLSVRLRSLSKLLAQSQIVPGQALRKVLFVFAILNDNDIDWMTTRGRREQVTAGTVLIQQGQPVEAIYMVLKGNLAITFTVQVDGKPVEKEIARRASGEIVGEMSFVETGVASCKRAKDLAQLANGWRKPSVPLRTSLLRFKIKVYPNQRLTCCKEPEPQTVVVFKNERKRYSFANCAIFAAHSHKR